MLEMKVVDDEVIRGCRWCRRHPRRAVVVAQSPEGEGGRGPFKDGERRHDRWKLVEVLQRHNEISESG